MKRWCTNNWQSNTRSALWKTLPSATPSTTKPTLTTKESNMGLRGEKPPDVRHGHRWKIILICTAYRPLQKTEIFGYRPICTHQRF